MPLAVDAIQSGHYVNGGFEALSGIARLMISQLAEHHFHHKNEHHLNTHSAEVMYHFTLNKAHALDLIYQDNKLNLRPLSDHAIEIIDSMIKVNHSEKQLNSNLTQKLRGLSFFIGSYAAGDKVLSDKKDPFFNQHLESINKIIEKLIETKTELTDNPKNYGGKKEVESVVSTLNDLIYKFQSAKEIYDQFESSETAISSGKIKAKNREALINDPSFQQLLKDQLLFCLGESNREQTVNHLSACRFYLWHVFNGNAFSDENDSRCNKYKLQINFDSIFSQLPQLHEAFILLNSTVHQSIEQQKSAIELNFLQKEYETEEVVFHDCLEESEFLNTQNEQASGSPKHLFTQSVQSNLSESFHSFISS